MGKPVKYSREKQPGTLKKGDIVVAVDPGNYGPTSATGYYAGVVPPAGKNVITVVDPYSPPRFYVPKDDSEIIRLAKQLGAPSNTATTASALQWLDSQDNYAVTSQAIPTFIATGSVLVLDAAGFSSYPQTGSVWYDLSGDQNNATLTNTSFINAGATSSIALSNSSSKIESTIIGAGGVNFSIMFNVKLKQTFNQIQVITSQTNTYSQTAQPTIQFNTFCITFSKSGNTITEIIYLNGSAVKTSTYTNAAFNIASPLILKFLTDNNAGTSQVQDVLVYNRTLSASEVLTNYQAIS